MHFGGSDDCSSGVLEAHMAQDRSEEVVIRQKQPRSTVIPNIVFAICMVAFIAFIFWQYGMRDNPSLGVTYNAHEPAPITSPSTN